MKKIIIFLLLFFSCVRAEARITVLACEPEWRSLVSEIVKDRARVIMAIASNQNPLEIRVTQGLANTFRTADMVICSGGGLEEKWLNRAINAGDNLQVITNKNNLMLAFNYASSKTPIRNGIPARIHLNPYNILPIAAEFTNRIKIADPLNADFYQKSYEEFARKWLDSIRVWEEAAKPLKGMKIVVSDNSWAELAKWLKLEVVATIDKRKGFIDNNQQLNEVLHSLKANPAQAIVFANYEDKTPILWLSERSKTRVILLPFTVGGAANSHDLFALFSTTINLLLADCTKVVCPSISMSQAVVQ